MEWGNTLVFAFVATCAFSFLLRTPRRAILASSVLGAVGYALMVFVERGTGWAPGGYAVAAVFVGLVGETLARVKRMPATIYIMTAIVPLVPGYSLVKTMQALVDSQLTEAGALFAQTILSFAAIAMGVALASVSARVCTSLIKDFRARRAGMGETR